MAADVITGEMLMQNVLQFRKEQYQKYVEEHWELVNHINIKLIEASKNGNVDATLTLIFDANDKTLLQQLTNYFADNGIVAKFPDASKLNYRKEFYNVYFSWK